MNLQLASICTESSDEIISRLKFIGLIQKDEKINVRNVNKQPNTFFTRLSRTFLSPDNRWNTLKFVRDVIVRSFEIIEKNLSDGNIITAQGIVADLVRARQGIANLSHTYIDDTKFCCDMDVMIQNIEVKIGSLKRGHPLIFEIEKCE